MTRESYASTIAMVCFGAFVITALVATKREDIDTDEIAALKMQIHLRDSVNKANSIMNDSNNKYHKEYSEIFNKLKNQQHK